LLLAVFTVTRNSFAIKKQGVPARYSSAVVSYIILAGLSLATLITIIVVSKNNDLSNKYRQPGKAPKKAPPGYQDRNLAASLTGIVFLVLLL
jgi:hypothetical protein